jgi:NTE family protein
VGGYKYNLALVLGGGGARGLAHIGVIRELERHDIRPDLIVGTSIGAIVGGMYAQTMDIDDVENRIDKFISRYGTGGKWLGFLSKLESERKEDLIHNITNYIKKHYMGLRSITAISLEEREVLLEPLNEFFTNNMIENTIIRFAAVAVDLTAGQQEVIDSGSIINAVYSSAAIQGVFPPFEYGDMLLADGGPAAVVPVEVAKKLRAKYVIAVNVDSRIKRVESFTSGLQVVLRSDLVGQERLKRFDLAMADIVISPEVHTIHWANFSKLKFCVKRGELAARRALRESSLLYKMKPWWRRLFSSESPQI